MDRFHVWTDFMNGNLLRIMSSSELEKREGKAAVQVLHPGELHTCGNVIWAYLIRWEWMLLLGLFSLGTSEWGCQPHRCNQSYSPDIRNFSGVAECYHRRRPPFH